ncbi:hypothetical protein [Polystyrenella longa]|uniref:hypothetical protein n=1 Tax=Polystyrenella longa TaxID=2528007 RepID=UPI0018D24ACA|nr:hypothetical protein [Polystyrenella longa]
MSITVRSKYVEMVMKYGKQYNMNWRSVLTKLVEAALPKIVDSDQTPFLVSIDESKLKTPEDLHDQMREIESDLLGYYFETQADYLRREKEFWENARGDDGFKIVE